MFLQQMWPRVQFHMGFTLINAQMLKNLGETNESSLKVGLKLTLNAHNHYLLDHYHMVIMRFHV